MAIGFNNDGECDGQHKVWSIHSIAITAGFYGFFEGLLNIIFSFTIWKDSDVAILNNKSKLCYMSLTYTAYLIIIGFAFDEYIYVDSDCKSSSLGSVILAWGIIKLLAPCCICCSQGEFSTGYGDAN